MYALFMFAYSLKYTSYILNDNGLKDYETKKNEKKIKDNCWSPNKES